MSKSYFLTLEVESDRPITLDDMRVHNPGLKLLDLEETEPVDLEARVTIPGMHFASDEAPPPPSEPVYCYRLRGGGGLPEMIFNSKADLVAEMNLRSAAAVNISGTGRLAHEWDTLSTTEEVPNFGNLSRGGDVAPTIGRNGGQVQITETFNESGGGGDFGPVSMMENVSLRESFADKIAREAVINKVMRDTGRSRGEVTEALLDTQGLLDDRPILQMFLNGALNVLIALIKSKLGL